MVESTNRSQLLWQDSFAARGMGFERISEHLHDVIKEQLATGKPSEDNGKLCMNLAVQRWLQDEVAKLFAAELKQL